MRKNVPIGLSAIDSSPGFEEDEQVLSAGPAVDIVQHLKYRAEHGHNLRSGLKNVAGTGALRRQRGLAILGVRGPYAHPCAVSSDLLRSAWLLDSCVPTRYKGKSRRAASHGTVPRATVAGAPSCDGRPPQIHVARSNRPIGPAPVSGSLLTLSCAVANRLDIRSRVLLFRSVKEENPK